MNADLMESPSATVAADGLTCVVARPALQRAVGAVAPFAKIATVLPVLGAIRVQGVGLARIQLTATNLDTWVRYSVDAAVDTTGDALITAPLLRDCVDRMAGDDIRLQEKAGRVVIKSGTARATIPGFSADEFPVMPVVSYAAERLPWPVLSAALKRTAWAASAEESRPILNGLSWRSAKGTTKLCATTGHAMALATLPFGTPIEDAIIPAAPLAHALKLFAGEAEVEVGWAGMDGGETTHIAFRSDDVEVLIRLITGPYPVYEQVIPRQGDHRTVQVQAGPFMAAIRRVATCASAKTRAIAFTFSGSTCRIEAQTEDRGEAFDVVTTGGWPGDAFAIGFDRDLITTSMVHANSDEVTLELRSDRAGAIIRPVTPSPDFEWMGLVMPLKIFGR